MGFIYAFLFVCANSSASISLRIIFLYLQNPPVKLTLDDSCISDGIEEGGDGVWSIVGGKVRKFNSS